MAGQAQPPRLVEPFAKNAPECTQAAPVQGGKTFPFPVDSQILVLNGAASLNDGFPPLNMRDPTLGGVPPFGIDQNGIAFILSAWAAYLAAGQLPLYDAALQTAMGGYAIGSVLAQAANPYETWTSFVDANVTDPDTGGAGWISSIPLHASSAPTAGTHADNPIPGPSDYFLDYDTTAGNVTLNGFVAVRDGQRITGSNTGAGLLVVGYLAGTAGNQIRANGPSLTVLQDDSFSIQFSAAIGAWVVV